MGLFFSRSAGASVRNVAAGTMNVPTHKFVQDLIASDVVVIFSMSRCPYCKMAKEVC